MESVGLYFDDLIVVGKNKVAHDNILKLVHERAVKYNMKLNGWKVQFKSKSVEFMEQNVFKECCRAVQRLGEGYSELLWLTNKTKLIIKMCISILVWFMHNYNSKGKEINHLFFATNCLFQFEDYTSSFIVLKCLPIHYAIKSYKISQSSFLTNW